MTDSPATTPNPATLIAHASKTVRNKNLILVAMFLVALAMFAKDGFYSYPLKNDALVQYMLNTLIPATPPKLDPTLAPILEQWPTWHAASHQQKTAMYELTRKNSIDGFHSELDIFIQQLITYALILANIATFSWFFHCQRRRVIADDTSLSPSPGITIPWDRIKTVDNSRWKKSGLVDLTYTDHAGAQRYAKLDDYIVDRAPLIEILNRIEQRAQHAEFLPKP